jgi:hypothetical protein
MKFCLSDIAVVLAVFLSLPFLLFFFTERQLFPVLRIQTTLMRILI